MQASQQLANEPTQAEPSFGGVHRSALDLVEHFVTPLAFVRQHVTKPGLPHVDFAAHFTTAPRQLVFVSVALACADAQLTYAPWFSALAQSQLAATAARAAATSAASAPAASQRALLVAGIAKRAATSAAAKTENRRFMSTSSASHTDGVPNPEGVKGLERDR